MVNTGIVEFCGTLANSVTDIVEICIIPQVIQHWIHRARIHLSLGFRIAKKLATMMGREDKILKESVIAKRIEEWFGSFNPKTKPIATRSSNMLKMNWTIVKTRISFSNRHFSLKSSRQAILSNKNAFDRFFSIYLVSKNVQPIVLIWVRFSATREVTCDDFTKKYHSAFLPWKISTSATSVFNRSHKT